MAFTSAKMGLKIWNLLTDLYDHVQLADNWAKVDYHDHSPGKGVQIPTEGIADAAVTAAKLSSATDPSGAYSTYRTYWRSAWNPAIANAAGVYVLYPGGGLVNAAGSAIGGFYLDQADFVNPGRTAYLRLELDVYTNAVSPTATFAASLFAVTGYAGTSGNLPTATLGSAISGSTATVAAPPANTVTRAVSTDLALPTSGVYVVAIIQTGAMAAGSGVSIDSRIAVKAV